MSIEGTKFLIGNIEENDFSDAVPLNVFTKRATELVRVGDDLENRVFSVTKVKNEIKTYIFQLYGYDLFIGFDESTRVLMLKSTITPWLISAHSGSTTLNEIHIGEGTNKLCWELNNDSLEAAIILSSNVSGTPRPKTQKWKFMSVRTFDKIKPRKKQ